MAKLVSVNILVLSFAIRIYITLDDSSMWILHPDEVFQNIEVAHSEVYGYGFRPYEYLPPPRDGLNSSNIAEAQEWSLGMYSLRSFLLPKVYMIVFHMKELLGVPMKPFKVARLFHATVASVLPVSVHRLMSKAFDCKDAALLAALMTALSPHLILLGTHTLANSFLAPFVFCILSYLAEIFSKKPEFHRKHRKKQKITHNSNGKCMSINNNWIASEINADNYKRLETHTTMSCNIKLCLGIGMLMGITCYMRVDNVIVFLLSIGILNFPLYQDFYQKLRIFIIIVIGVIFGLLIGGIDDYFCYGFAFISPWQWLKFNVFSKKAETFFGISGFTFYLRQVFFHGTATTILSILSLLYFLMLCYDGYHKKLDYNKKQYIRMYLMFLVMMLCYSFKGHKEIRFMHNVITLFLAISAYPIVVLTRTIVKSEYSQRIFLIILITLYAIDSKHSIRKLENEHGHQDSNDLNKCLDFMGSQSDVKGIFSDTTFHITGGYSLLHKNIPLFFVNHFEMNEYGLSSRVKMKSIDPFSRSKNISLAVVNRLSNFVTLENVHLAMKYALSDSTYNYFLIRKNRKMIKRGFKEIFLYGKIRVLVRIESKGDHSYLKSVADAIPLGRNATVLEYEGSWLRTLGLYELAKERLEFSLILDPFRVRTYQLLCSVYDNLHQNELVDKTFRKCVSLHSFKRCSEPVPQTVLHREYDRIGQFIKNHL